MCSEDKGLLVMNIHILDWIVQCFTSHSPTTQYRLYGRRFLQVKRPNQQYQSTEGTIVRENVRNTAKKRKKSRHDFLDFEKNVKNVKNVEVITYMPIVLNTMVTTLNQFCCLSHNSKAIIF